MQFEWLEIKAQTNVICSAPRALSILSPRTSLFDPPKSMYKKSQYLRSALERRLGVLEQLHKVRLVPLSCLGAGLERISESTEGIVALGSCVAGTITLTTGLDPDERVNQARASVGRRANAKAGALDVAPVTPRQTETLDCVSAGVDNSLGRHASSLQVRGEELDVGLLVCRLVVLAVSSGELAGCEVPSVPASNVGRDTAERRRLAGGDVSISEDLGTGLCERLVR